MNICIPLGGLETRVRDLWNGPKCLIPLGGRPLIERLFEKLIAEVDFQQCVFCIGAKGSLMAEWFSPWRSRLPEQHRSRMHLIVEDFPLGTAGAVNNAVRTQKLGGETLLVVNGDTWPLYSVKELLRYHDVRPGSWATIAVITRSHQWRDIYAGAAVLSPQAVEEIGADRRTYDLPAHLLGALRYYVPGFIDVGTPEGFRRAKEWRE